MYILRGDDSPKVGNFLLRLGTGMFCQVNAIVGFGRGKKQESPLGFFCRMWVGGFIQSAKHPSDIVFLMLGIPRG